MDDGLYTNRNTRSDFVENAILKESKNSSYIYIASAFFTNIGLINKLVERGCHIKLVVRLGFPTSPDALRQLISNQSIEVYYFTGNTFHSKLYIFGDSTALVGSANLTKSGVRTNTEIMIRITSEDNRLDELITLFNDYWTEASLLTIEEINRYQGIYDKSGQIEKDLQQNESQITKVIGKVEFGNIQREKKKKTKEQIFIEGYRKRYSECVLAFRRIQEIYEQVGKRKVTEDTIPLRLEIDSFISFVRDTSAKGESWALESGSNGPQIYKIEEHINSWHDSRWEHFENTIVNRNFPLINEVFKNSANIKSADDESLFDALSVIHSFHDRLRFYAGGLQTLKKEFFEKNKANDIRDSLSYLVHGSDPIEQRMYNLIFVDEYRLHEFGRSNVQELVGWINKENLPVINARTTKILKFFGFDVKQL